MDDHEPVSIFGTANAQMMAKIRLLQRAVEANAGLADARLADLDAGLMAILQRAKDEGVSLSPDLLNSIERAREELARIQMGMASELTRLRNPDP